MATSSGRRLDRLRRTLAGLSLPIRKV